MKKGFIECHQSRLAIAALLVFFGLLALANVAAAAIVSVAVATVFVFQSMSKLET